MKIAIVHAAIVAGMAIASAGCSSQPPSAAAAETPPAGVPVGPVPGVTSQPPLPQNPLAGNAVAMTEGRRLFVQFNCSGCHGGHAGGGMGPSLRDAVWIYGGDDAHIYASIAQGRANGMPTWGAKIPEQEIWQLVAYIKSLRTPDEPEPPE
jgi:cytochrome c oxidase cbb3-type subunit 3